jgi:hypothetical protein
MSIFIIFDKTKRMKLIFSSVLFSTFLLLFACGSKGEEKKENTSEKKGCFYTYNHASTLLEWTAFKFTDKKGVTGTFNEVIVESPEGSDDPEMLLSKLSFKIPTGTVETQNEERNGKISGIFFKSLATDTIRGSVKELRLQKGTAVIVLLMNGIRKDVKGICTFEDGLFSFKATIDVNDWNGAESIQSLNNACKDLHTGTDGKSKLWSTVDLSFNTQLQSDCQ